MGFRVLRSLSRPPVAAVVLLFFFASQAWAWGNTGHRIIADIAWDHLDAATRQKLRPFLGDYNLASISTWPDDVRSGRSETAPWHYVDIPKDASGYEAKDCPDDNCVVEQIKKFARILGDPQRPFAERSEALNFLVHFVGDISQPLHAVAEARGGNDIHVTVFGSTQCGDYACNFHSVWDSSLIDHTGLREHAYAQQLEKMIAAKHLKPGSGDPAAWANDSLQLARPAWVEPQASIDEAYYQRERSVVDTQLALAGLRLARLLNEEMKNTGKS
jgi:hypothetical protein